MTAIVTTKLQQVCLSQAKLLFLLEPLLSLCDAKAVGEYM